MNRKQEVACWIIGLAVAYAMMNGGHIEVPFLVEEWMPTAGVALIGALVPRSVPPCFPCRINAPTRRDDCDAPMSSGLHGFSR